MSEVFWHGRRDSSWVDTAASATAAAAAAQGVNDTRKNTAGARLSAMVTRYTAHSCGTRTPTSCTYVPIRSVSPITEPCTVYTRANVG